MKGRIKRTGVRDVARLAGVAPITVSRALAAPDRVAKETRDRIAAAVAATGYIPDRVAGSLSSNQTRTIGAVVPTLRNSIAANFTEGMADVLHRRGYQLLLGSSEFLVEQEEALVVEFLSRRADGIYLTGATHSERTRQLLRTTGIPTVEVASLPDDPIDMAVGFSNRDAAFEMTSVLASRGYTRIAFACMPLSGNERQAQRLEGFRDAVQRLGIDADPALVAETSLTLTGGATALRALLERRPDVQAVFCTGDVIAAGMLFECQRLGIAVPDQIAIAGFDDLEIAAQIRPALTTVHLPSHEVGAKAAEMLLDRLAGRTDFRRVVELNYRIVVRESA